MVDKEELLESIIDDLSGGEGATIEELALKYEVSTRTIQRHFGTIRESFGFRIEPKKPATRVPRWVLEGNAKLDVRRIRSRILDRGLSNEEISLVILALNNDGLTLDTKNSKTLEQLKDRFIALANTENEFARPIKDFIVAMPQITKVKAIDSPLLVNLVHVLKSKSWCTIRYRSPRSQEARTRNIYPYCIFEHNYGVYVLCYLADKQTVTALAIERIEHLQTTREKQQYPDLGDYRTYLLQSFDLFMSDELDEVEVWFHHDQAPYIRERIWGDDQVIKTNEDGSIVISFKTRGLEGVKRWVLSNGRHAKLKRPEQLAEKIAAEIEAMGRM